jgi:5-hydroxyisourate hydrolase-like protein (transthyretin family)
MDKSEFLPNETIDLKGWVEYNGQPASNVLVQVWLEKERDKLVSDNVTSNANGNFSSILSIPPEIEPGNYTVSVTSLYQEIHSNICTYQFEELPITIRTS